ncbi:hypothetical protein J6590_086475 [Homalodisca vitripennis]|nr:hypothetical protein J6590_086475 [Homalodisca vitripennis]
MIMSRVMSLTVTLSTLPESCGQNCADAYCEMEVGVDNCLEKTRNRRYRQETRRATHAMAAAVCAFTTGAVCRKSQNVERYFLRMAHRGSYDLGASGRESRRCSYAPSGLRQTRLVVQLWSVLRSGNRWFCSKYQSRRRDRAGTCCVLWITRHISLQRCPAGNGKCNLRTTTHFCQYDTN